MKRRYINYIDEGARKSLLTKSNRICRELITAPKLLESGDLDRQMQGMDIILRAIDHIEWLDRFFYEVIDLDEEVKPE
jgi:hypothetical protein